MLNMADITYTTYNERSFIVRGDKEKYKDLIKTIGGRWNSRVKDGEPGWLVGFDKEDELKKLIDLVKKADNINNIGVKSRKTQNKYRRALSRSGSEDDEDNENDIPMLMPSEDDKAKKKSKKDEKSIDKRKNKKQSKEQSEEHKFYDVEQDIKKHMEQPEVKHFEEQEMEQRDRKRREEQEMEQRDRKRREEQEMEQRERKRRDEQEMEDRKREMEIREIEQSREKRRREMMEKYENTNRLIEEREQRDRERKQYTQKAKVSPNDPISYYKSFKKQNFNKSPSSESSSLFSDSSSNSDSDSDDSETSDDFPVPGSPKKRTNNRADIYENEMLKKMRDLQKRLHEMEIKNKRLQSEKK
jgi:hypothetical protein